MKNSTIVLVIAAPILAAVLGTHMGKALAASGSDARWSDNVKTAMEYCRYRQTELTETECLIRLGAMI
jgi:hypothetical protein